MAGQNITANIEAQGNKMDTQGTRIDSPKSSLKTEFRALHRMLGASLVLLAILVAIGIFNTALNLTR